MWPAVKHPAIACFFFSQLSLFEYPAIQYQELIWNNMFHIMQAPKNVKIVDDCQNKKSFLFQNPQLGFIIRFHPKFYHKIPILHLGFAMNFPCNRLRVIPGMPLPTGCRHLACHVDGMDQYLRCLQPWWKRLGGNCRGLRVFVCFFWFFGLGSVSLAVIRECRNDLRYMLRWSNNLTLIWFQADRLGRPQA